MDANRSMNSPAVASSPTMTVAGQIPRGHRHKLNVRRTGIVLKPSNSRVVIRPFEPTNEHRVERIIARVMSLSDQDVDLMVEDVMREFHSRHQKTRHFFLHRFDQVRRYLPPTSARARIAAC